jgi:hypothetical protein
MFLKSVEKLYSRNGKYNEMLLRKHEKGDYEHHIRPRVIFSLGVIIQTSSSPLRSPVQKSVTKKSNYFLRECRYKRKVS